VLKDEATFIDERQAKNPTHNVGTIKLSTNRVSEAISSEEVIMEEEAAEDEAEEQVGTSIESPPRLHLECSLPTR
jgi:hypothetical protein